MGSNKNSTNIDIIKKSKHYQTAIQDMPIFKEFLTKELEIRSDTDTTVGFSHALFSNTLPLLVAVLELGFDTYIITQNNMKHDPQVIELLKQTDLVIDPEPQQYDYTVDCIGYFSNNPARKGSVEVTRSGIIKYNNLFREKPGITTLVDVDSTKSKLLETFIGNPRAVLSTLESFKGDLDIFFKQQDYNKVAIIGFGKIGRGLAREITERSLSEVLVCDISFEILNQAKRLGFETYLVGKNKAKNSKNIQDVSIIFTATGYEDVMTNYFEKNNLTHSLKINVGAVDEWGSDYTEEDVFHSKHEPFNFNLIPPTENKYIDPILFAQYKGLAELITNFDRYSPGYNSLPKSIDQEIVSKFDSINNNESKKINRYFPNL